MGIDYGLRRVGIAVSDETQTVAFPFRAIEFSSRRELIRILKGLIEENGIEEVVVGLPLTLKGKMGEIALEAKKFGEEIEKVTGIKVNYVDERFTSVEAERILRSTKSKLGRNDKVKVDLISAVIILQTFLDARRK